MRVRRTGSSRLRALTCGSAIQRARESRHSFGTDRYAESRYRRTQWVVGVHPHPGGDARACTSRGHRHRALRQTEYRPRDHGPLDLARPFVDLGHLRVPEVALDRELLREAVPAEDLDRLGSLPAGDLRREQLRFRACLAVRLALLLQ